MSRFDAGQPLPTLTRCLGPEQVHRYAEASGDDNPLHLDPEFAARTEFKKPIVHGMLGLALVSEAMTQGFGLSWLRGGTLRARFKGPVYVGEEVTVHGRVTKELSGPEEHRLECSLALCNSEGEDVINVVATVPLPPGGS